MLLTLPFLFCVLFCGSVSVFVVFVVVVVDAAAFGFDASKFEDARVCPRYAPPSMARLLLSRVEPRAFTTRDRSARRACAGMEVRVNATAAVVAATKADRIVGDFVMSEYNVCMAACFVVLVFSLVSTRSVQGLDKMERTLSLSLDQLDH